MRTTVRLLAASVLVALAAPAALAEQTMNPTRMTCESVQSAIRELGAVKLRYMSTRVANLPLYNRYVRSSNFCEANEVAVPDVVPTADRPKCRVNVCEHRDFDEPIRPFLFPD